ncbi:MAG: lysoplasmalogenase [Gammaproteobacteria bacterium]|nr:lysoplasmalogenase [Gammaproteobacteria bacterium]
MLNTKKGSIPLIKIAIIISATCAIYASYLSNPHFYYLLKPLTTVLILSQFFTGRLPFSEDIKKQRHRIIAGLVFCLIGDIFLLDYTFFAYGLGAFLIAHIIFAFVFSKLAGTKQYWLALISLGAISLVYYWAIFDNLGNLRLPVAVYLCCIVVMAWQSLRVCFHRRDAWGLMLAFATICFLVSDSTIAANEFIAPFMASNIIILGLYWISISIIALLFSNGIE